MLATLAQLLDAAKPFDPTGLALPSGAPGQRIRKLAGLAPARILERVRAAYLAAGFPPVSSRWEGELRSAVRFALTCRMGKAALPPHLSKLTSGAGILTALKSRFPEDIPPAITAKRIDALLRSTTLTRGGGRGQKRNVDAALDCMISAAGHTRRP
ncbi:MAG: hypothetical protein IPM35_02665 [Myxococcales bacterium]|nr:hypothetical protein [Myxococcales bacterium]